MTSGSAWKRKDLRAPGPADPAEVLDRQVHRIVMEWPETLAVLRDRAVDVGSVGGRRLGALPDASGIAEDLARATRWRSR